MNQDSEFVNSSDFIEHIKKLKKLYDSEVLTFTEYSEKKGQLINELKELRLLEKKEDFLLNISGLSNSNIISTEELNAIKNIIFGKSGKMLANNPLPMSNKTPVKELVQADNSISSENYSKLNTGKSKYSTGLIIGSVAVLIAISAFIIYSLTNVLRKSDTDTPLKLSGDKRTEVANEKKDNPIIKTEPTKPTNTPITSAFTTYRNPNYNLSINIPEYLIKYSLTDGKDGHGFKYSDGFDMKVYGNNNENLSNISVSEAYSNELKKYESVTYKVLKTDWFVISGYDNGQIYYIKKYILKNHSITLFILMPKNLKEKYDNIVTDASKSFRPD